MVLDSHKQNIICCFVYEVIENKNEADRTLDYAYTKVAAKWRGYELDDEFLLTVQGI